MTGKPTVPGTWGDWAIIEHKPAVKKSCEACAYYCYDGSCGKHPSIVIKEVGFDYYKKCKYYLPSGCGGQSLKKDKSSPECRFSRYIVSTNCFICRNAVSPHYSNKCKKCKEFQPVRPQKLAEKMSSLVSSYSQKQHRYLPKRKLIDIHSHVVFDVDDGAEDLQMSLELLRMYEQQGVTDLVCTSHSWGKTENYVTHFNELKKAAKDEKIGVRLYCGCEIECSKWKLPLVVKYIIKGEFQTINKTDYILLEFNKKEKPDDIIYCIKAVSSLTGKKSILAHTERYCFLKDHFEVINELQKLGCLLQINAYSLIEEEREDTRTFARELLKQKRVAFIGSDGHRSNHREPNVRSGIRYVYANCNIEYAHDVCWRNAERLLLRNQSDC